jgi:hypothetical protein
VLVYRVVCTWDWLTAWNPHTYTQHAGSEHGVFFYNFPLAMRSTVGTQMWQLTNQHRIMIQKPETGSKLPVSINLLMYRQINFLHITAIHTGCENLFIKLLLNVTPSLEIGPCAPCVVLSLSPMIHSLINDKFQWPLTSPVRPIKLSEQLYGKATSFCISSAVTCSREQKPNFEADDTVASRLAYYYNTCQKKIWSLGENI